MGGDLLLGESDDRPSGEERFEILLGVGNEAGGAVVAAAAIDEDAALDLDQRPALDVGEVGPPFALRMKSKLALQLRPAKSAPVERELRFEPGGIRFGAGRGCVSPNCGAVKVNRGVFTP